MQVILMLILMLLIPASSATEEEIGAFEIQSLDSLTTAYNPSTNHWTLTSTYFSSKNEGIYSEIYSNEECTKGEDNLYTNSDIMESKAFVTGSINGGFEVTSEVIIKNLDSLKQTSMWTESSVRGVGNLDYCLSIGLQAQAYPIKVTSEDMHHSLYVNYISEIPSQVLATLEAVDPSNQAEVTVESEVTLDGVDQDEFQKDPEGQTQIIQDTIEDTVNSGGRRLVEKRRSRHLQGFKEVTVNSVSFESSGEALVDFTITMIITCDGECSVDEVSDLAESSLGDVTSTLTESISSGAFTETLVETAQEAGSAAFDNVSVDASSLQVTVTYSITSDSPTASPVQEVDHPFFVQLYITISEFIGAIICSVHSNSIQLHIAISQIIGGIISFVCSNSIQLYIAISGIICAIISFVC